MKTKTTYKTRRRRHALQRKREGREDKLRSNWPYRSAKCSRAAAAAAVVVRGVNEWIRWEKMLKEEKMMKTQDKLMKKKQVNGN